MTPQTAFVTGGTGFIGSHLVEMLKTRGYTEIRCLVRSDLKWLKGLDVTVVPGDLHNLDALQEGCRNVDMVFHVAAATGTKQALTWDRFEQENVTATLNLLKAAEAAAPQLKRIVVTSSLAVIGRCEADAADEQMPLQPVSLYGRSKAEMERKIRPWMARLPVTVIRPPAVYGPREADIYAFFKTVSRGLVPIVGSGREPALSLVHVRDLVRGMIDAGQAPNTVGETYFLGSPHAYSWNEVKHATCTALDRTALTIPIPSGLVQSVGAVVEFGGKLIGRHMPLNREKAREIRYACTKCRIDKARRDFGYDPQIDLIDGIQETITWYRANNWL